MKKSFDKVAFLESLPEKAINLLCYATLCGLVLTDPNVKRGANVPYQPPVPVANKACFKDGMMRPRLGPVPVKIEVHCPTHS